MMKSIEIDSPMTVSRNKTYIAHQSVLLFAGYLFLVSTPNLASASLEYLFEKEPARHALVIANANYKHLSNLPSAEVDAKLMLERMEALGFSVTFVPEVPSRLQLENNALPTFRSKIKEGDLVLFYFSGHGFSYGPHNFLAPADMPLLVRDRDVADIAISVEGVESYFADSKPGLIVILIDACRTIASFVISDKKNQNVVKKGPGDQKQSSHGVNVLAGYATRPGTVALGSSADGTASLFTGRLADHIQKKEREFGALFNDVSSDVRVASDDEQKPGLFDWSDSDLYLKPSQAILEQQKEAWLASLDSGRREDVLRYSYRFSISRHAAAARAWLEKNAVNPKAPQYTFLSPAAVERAWRSTEGSLAIVPGATGFAFERVLNVQASEVLQAFDDRKLGLIPSGGAAGPVTSSKFLRDLQIVQAHGTVVATKEFVARTEPSSSAQIAFRLPFGGKVTVRGVKSLGRQGTWLAGNVPGTRDLIYLPLQASSESKPAVELGLSLREVMVPPRNSGIRDLVEVDEIHAAIDALKKEKRTITWISIAAGPTEDRTEADARAARLTHAEYLLRRAGIDGRRITAVAKSYDVIGPGVRLRFFGY